MNTDFKIKWMQMATFSVKYNEECTASLKLDNYTKQATDRAQ
jgi:hypothetical protein